MKHLLIIMLAALSFSSCKEEKKTFAAPVSDLGHVDLVLDSAAFHAILQDSFLVNEFAVVSQDTTMYAKPSYDIYLLGIEAFLHVSLAKAYWENKAGSAVMIFQTRRPGKHDSLLLAWKQFYKDSLNATSFKGGDFNTGEVLPYRKKDSLKPAEPNFTPILMSYSVKGYKNWGFSDSIITNGLSMQEFMRSWDSRTASRLFKKVRALHIQLDQQEFTEMESALYTMGYTKKEKAFTHEFNPSVYYTITETNLVPKYTKIEIELAAKTPEQTIQLGDTYTVKVKDALMVIEQSEKK
jgi:Family of unknown function (DUF5829)